MLKSQAQVRQKIWTGNLKYFSLKFYDVVCLLFSLFFFSMVFEVEQKYASTHMETWTNCTTYFPSILNFKTSE